MIAVASLQDVEWMLVIISAQIFFLGTDSDDSKINHGWQAR